MRGLVGSNELVEFHVHGFRVAVLGVLNQKHHEEGDDGGPVLIISCQVSLKPKRGPETAQRSSAPSAIANATGCPAACDVHFANRVKKDVDFVGIMAIWKGTSARDRGWQAPCAFPSPGQHAISWKSRRDPRRRMLGLRVN